MTDQDRVGTEGAGDATREATDGQSQGFDKERVILAIVGLIGAAVIVAMNVR
ncbi:MAG: hypothetical protein ABIT10_09075 [Alteraurantiacibacter sp.]